MMTADTETGILVQFWGKTGAAVNREPDWHPCVLHCLDVAACGGVLLRHEPSMLEATARRLGWSADETRIVLLKLLLLHDAGKLTRPFQALSQRHWPSALGPWPGRIASEWRHAHFSDLVMSGLFRSDRLAWCKGWSNEVLDALAAPFAGHHGRPVRLRKQRVPRLSRIIDATCEDAIEVLADLGEALFPVGPLDEPDEDAAKIASWWLSGWAVRSDWLGSNRRWFPFTPPTVEIEDYWSGALEKAERAIHEAGLVPVASSTTTGFRALTVSPHKPTEMQVWAEEVPLGEGPALAVIEDVTGSGKTEAAIVLAHRMMQAGKAEGIYVALPTMATANAMYGRMAEIYRRLFASDGKPSLALAHGARRLHDGFGKALSAGDYVATDEEVNDEHEAPDGNESAAMCSAWIGDSTRTVFLAQMAVGTIDQALLAVLPAKYQSLRLAGLARRVLIVDEAHAYDSYMGTELERLLEFHAAQGGSAVVMSATLPMARRQSLLGAFARGRGMPAPQLAKKSYPLATLWSGGSPSERGTSARADLVRELAVERLGSVDEATTRVAEAARGGMAVAWVRNTVDDALEAAVDLEAMGADVTLFHARFAMGDRLRIEEEAVRRFGRHGTVADRRGRVLVATQVIEQSLDLDFDLMVSDLAPVDLLLQRAGRICRHDRGERAGPRLLVLSPDPEAEIEVGWLTTLFPKAGKIYPDHGLLWRSASHLFSRSSWQVPSNVRDLIEIVYDPDGECPAALESATIAATGNKAAGKALAWTNLLELRDGYNADVQKPWDSDTRVPTRLGEDRTILRLARLEGDEVVPLVHDDDPRRAWALSEVSVRKAWVDQVEPPTEHRSAIDRALSSWSRLDEHKRLVLMQPAEGEGGLIETGQGASLAYHALRGLTRA